jgi:hypothetical protein
MDQLQDGKTWVEGAARAKAAELDLSLECKWGQSEAGKDFDNDRWTLRLKAGGKRQLPKFDEDLLEDCGGGDAEARSEAEIKVTEALNALKRG